MPVENTRTPMRLSRRSLIAAVSSMLVTVLATVGVFYAAGWLTFVQPNRQAMIHDMGSQVMPFDLTKTTHVFKMTVTGGLQQVIAKDPADTAQIGLIQQHVQHEAILFRSGDFSDPTALHGGNMPGVNELTAGVAQISIEYAVLPNGAQITFTTHDLNLVTALHQWFGAQLSDHGQDATYQ